LASIGCKEYVFHSHLEKLREKSSENRTKFERNSWRRRLFPRACATGAARPQIRALLLRRISVHERSGRAARASDAAAVVIVADKKSMRETGTNERTNHRPRRAFDSVVGVVDAALLGRPAQRTALYRNQCAIAVWPASLCSPVYQCVRFVGPVFYYFWQLRSSRYVTVNTA